MLCHAGLAAIGCVVCSVLVLAVPTILYRRPPPSTVLLLLSACHAGLVSCPCCFSMLYLFRWQLRAGACML